MLSQNLYNFALEFLLEFDFLYFQYPLAFGDLITGANLVSGMCMALGVKAETGFFFLGASFFGTSLAG